jgi:UTP--glucose-1-phosphate uridylyltransferase
MSSIKKAVFVVAGFGTRFLPFTKSVPKEMLPIVDKPIIQYLVEEAVDAGIEEVVFVVGRGKEALTNHFDKSFELEAVLQNKGKLEILDSVGHISKMASYTYVRQPEPRGDGDALLYAKPFINLPEPVLVVFPDYIMPRENNTFQKMIEFYAKSLSPVIATDFVPKSKISEYGILDTEKTEYKGVKLVKDFIEKPSPEKAPSNLINNGYAIITPEIWELLSTAKSTVSDGEVRLADSFIKYVSLGHPLYALEAEKPGYDCGNKLGFLEANIDFALTREDLKEDLKNILKKKINN